MKVIMPAFIENATSDADIASNVLYQQYRTLFEEFQSDYAELLAAQSPAIVIDELVSYFRALDLVTTLANLKDGDPVPQGMVMPEGRKPTEPKKKYYRIPLDEPHFKINTDDRTI